VRRPDRALSAAILLAVCLAGCGGGIGGVGSTPPPGSDVTGVTVTPVNASVEVGGTLQFTAVVSGDGNVDPTVNWAVDHAPGGSAASGTISPTGLYVTPFPAPKTVIVTATSKADATKSASVTVTLTPPPPGQGPDLTVDAAASRRAINPLIYGMNQYSAAFDTVASAVRLPVERWGGDATTRYNWQLDVYNSASDWYFSTDPNSNTGYPDSSEFNSTVLRDRNAGVKTMGTVPMIGWTTKRQRACGYSVAKYGAQKEVNPYNSDCGKGVLLDGSQIENNDPNDTSIPIGPQFAKDWIKYLVRRFGDARHGGVAIYSLDNEPELWQFVHIDVHPAYPGYDDLTNLGITYATAIKQTDPTTLVSGPATSTWMGYFFSPQDWRSGWNTGPDYVYYGNPVDRRAHGDVPFLEWYLKQFAAAERKGGRRLLDFLDIHGYIAPDDVQFKPAGNTANQVLRLESVRAFWDSTYFDTTVNDTPYLVPRMRDWVARNYPRTMTAITEYNLGALDHVNGALAQADLLGVFGREGLDMAAIWAPPGAGTPGFYAYKIFRNYDDAGSGFGDVSVSARSEDQSKLSVYAAERSSDHALTVLVVNKSFGDLSSTIALSGFRGASTAAAYRFSADTSGIARLPDQPVGDRSLSATFPASSLTLFVLDER